MFDEEKFIERNISELCTEYSMIHGANINILRISPDFVDSNKICARRLLYSMFLTDRGKRMRKVAAIIGECIAKLHHHGQCLEKNTKFLLADGTVKTIKELTEIGRDQEVFAYNKHSGKVEYAKATNFRITKEVSNLYRIRYSNGAVIKATDNHPFLVVGSEDTSMPIWVTADRLRVGDCSFPASVDRDIVPGQRIDLSSIRLLLGKHDGTFQGDMRTVIVQSYITSIKVIRLEQPEPVYDFTVDGLENAMVLLEGTSGFTAYTFLHNSSVKGTLVGLSQWWTNNLPLIEIGGNGGSVTGDEAGADRYIHAKLTDYAYDCFFSEWNESAVDMVLGADEETMEPVYLPAKYPNILINGSLGIGYGLASSIPPFNFKEVIDATIKLMKNPNARIVLIPDSPSGCDVIETNFLELTESPRSSYAMRCKYTIDPVKNEVIITNLPYSIYSNDIRARFAELKEAGKFPELIDMHDFSGEKVDIQLKIRKDVNPYKFVKKMLRIVSGLERTYAVIMNISNNYQVFDWSIKQVLMEWINFRRDQKRVLINHKRTALMAEQRINDIKIFLMNKDNLDTTIELFRKSKNKQEIEENLLKRYRDSIHMDSLQAKTLSELRMYKLSRDEYEACLKRRDEINEEMGELETILNTPHGIDDVIIGELREGVKKYGTPRKSNVVPQKVTFDNDVEGFSILYLSPDGILQRREATNVKEEPVPMETDGFAIKTGNDDSFALFGETGCIASIQVQDVPVGGKLPLQQYMETSALNGLGKIVAIAPISLDSPDMCCMLVSKKGIVRKILINQINIAAKHPFITLADEEDRVISGVIVKDKSVKDILICTKFGKGQRFDPNMIRSSRNISNRDLKVNRPLIVMEPEDEVIGAYAINPEKSQYLLYITSRGRIRLNNIRHIPNRKSRHDAMFDLITINKGEVLIAVLTCNKKDTVTLYYQDGKSEIVDVNSLKLSTMAIPPKKIATRNMISNRIVKAKVN